MDFSLGKRKLSTMQTESEGDSTISPQQPSTGSSHAHFSSENPCKFNATSSSSNYNSLTSSVQRAKLTPNSNSLSSFSNSSDGKRGAGGVVNSNSVGSFKQPYKTGPFSVETPYFSKETPLVLATARNTGSSITASCNTDSIRQLQNPYSERVTGSATSEYFQRKTPTSRTLPGPRSQSVTSTSANPSVTDTGEDNLSNTDVQHVRQMENSLSTTNDSQVFNFNP